MDLGLEPAADSRLRCRLFTWDTGTEDLGQALERAHTAVTALKGVRRSRLDQDTRALMPQSLELLRSRHSNTPKMCKSCAGA